jgi:hypothetical protein
LSKTRRKKTQNEKFIPSEIPYIGIVDTIYFLSNFFASCEAWLMTESLMTPSLLVGNVGYTVATFVGLLFYGVY